MNETKIKDIQNTIISIGNNVDQIEKFLRHMANDKDIDDYAINYILSDPLIITDIVVKLSPTAEFIRIPIKVEYSKNSDDIWDRTMKGIL